MGSVRSSASNITGNSPSLAAKEERAGALSAALASRGAAEADAVEVRIMTMV